jgi:hypothetical protein
MLDDPLLKYFNILDTRAIDPYEFVEIEGRKYPAIDLFHYGREQRQIAHRAANKKWKAANPDKVKGQKGREADKKYYRPFVTIDAEGQTFPGFDEFDKAGNCYPQHRAILWGAAGWHRLHSSTEIANGASLQGSSEDVFEWLLSLPENSTKRQGCRMA